MIIITEALNLPKDHPARYAELFYDTEALAAYAHFTSTGRTMQSKGGNEPVRMIAPGRGFIAEIMMPHSPMFPSGGRPCH